ncbi:MAG: sigma 54-interacting transcriptional regulator [Pseudomonadota bacterium]
MKVVETNVEAAAVSFGALLERIEIMRTALRWQQKLDRPQIDKLLSQCTSLREEVLRISHKERFVKASMQTGGKKKRSPAQRRKELIERDFRFDGVFGENRQLLDSLEIAEKAAPTDLPVLIDGESGTGKELMAKVIHANGKRADKVFVSVNCGAIPDNLLESELFGHKKGAFTGASADRKGKFESADGGTIFLDEIGELPMPGQVKLLRVLQSSEVQRVGSDQSIGIDTRIVAATNRNLFKMCQEGTFREDLFYRISVMQVTIPPLRERRDEIPILVEYLIDAAAESLDRHPVKLSRRLSNFMQKYDYPGNIRELRNIIFRISCLATDIADIEHLPDHVRPQAEKSRASLSGIDPTSTSLADAKRIASDEVEKEYLEQGLAETNGQVTELAKLLGMNRTHVQTLLKKHSLSSKAFRQSKAGTP